MKALLATLSLIVAFCILPTTATVYCYDSFYGGWYCAYSCCYSYTNCCNSLGSVYWYAWVIIVIFVLLCVCACAGGGYGYRRYYYVRRLQYPPATTTVVTSATTTNQGYSQFSNPNPNQYQPYSGAQNAPPAYQPAPPKY